MDINSPVDIGFLHFISFFIAGSKRRKTEHSKVSIEGLAWSLMLFTVLVLRLRDPRSTTVLLCCCAFLLAAAEGLHSPAAVEVFASAAHTCRDRTPDNSQSFHPPTCVVIQLCFSSLQLLRLSCTYVDTTAALVFIWLCTSVGTAAVLTRRYSRGSWCVNGRVSRNPPA